MNEKLFLDDMAEILDTDATLSLSAELAALDGWDSLAILSFMAEMERFAASKLSPQRVREAKTLADLYAMMKHE